MYKIIIETYNLEYRPQVFFTAFDRTMITS